MQSKLLKYISFGTLAVIIVAMMTLIYIRLMKRGDTV